MIRCDLCNSEIQDMCWTYKTPNTASGPENADGELFWAEDEEWAACDDCHTIIQTADKDSWNDVRGAAYRLAHRSLITQLKQTGPVPNILHNAMVAEIARIHGLFWKNLSVDTPPIREPGHRMPIDINEGER